MYGQRFTGLISDNNENLVFVVVVVRRLNRKKYVICLDTPTSVTNFRSPSPIPDLHQLIHYINGGQNVTTFTHHYNLKISLYSRGFLGHFWGL